VAFGRLCFSAAAATYQEQVLSYKDIDELLMKAGLSLNTSWQGTSKPLLGVNLSSFMFDTLQCYGLYSAFVWFKKILFLATK